MSSNADLQPLFRWRETIAQSSLPATTRQVLTTISMYMGMDGTGAFPTQETIARSSGLNLRTVKEHLEFAEAAGWIERAPRRRRQTRSFRFGTEYLPRFPCADLDGEPGSPLAVVPPGRKRRALRRKARPGNGEPGAMNGEPGATLVNPATTISSMNSPEELGACKNGSTTASEIEKEEIGRESISGSPLPYRRPLLDDELAQVAQDLIVGSGTSPAIERALITRIRRRHGSEFLRRFIIACQTSGAQGPAARVLLVQQNFAWNADYAKDVALAKRMGDLVGESYRIRLYRTKDNATVAMDPADSVRTMREKGRTREQIFELFAWAQSQEDDRWMSTGPALLNYFWDQLEALRQWQHAEHGATT